MNRIKQEGPKALLLTKEMVSKMLETEKAIDDAKRKFLISK